MNSINFEAANCLGTELSEFKNYQFLLTYFDESSFEEIGSNYYFSNVSKGISVVYNEEKRLSAIQFYFNKKDGFENFENDLPFAISVSDDFDMIKKKTGLDKFQSGGGDLIPVLGKTNDWRKFYFQDCYLHVEQNDLGQLIIVTVGSLR